MVCPQKNERKKSDGWNTNQNQMKNAHPFYIVFEVLKVLIIIICKMQPLDLLFLVFYVRFHISRYHFSLIFRASYNIIWKKIVVTNFFFNRFTQTPHPLNGQNSLSVTKVFCWCSLIDAIRNKEKKDQGVQNKLTLKSNEKKSVVSRTEYSIYIANCKVNWFQKFNDRGNIFHLY